ncbi:hypothetical protein FRB90_007290 [Tulasnella sp. 427]|nr:hypothetical protein FRB90_007290 [Tulasnella sp. 427]
MYFGVKFVQRLLSSLASSRLKGLKCFKYVADLDRRQDAQLEQSLKTFILSQRGLEELELLSYQIQNTDFIMDLCEAFPLLHNFCGNLSYFTREQFRATLTVLANGWPALRRIGIARTGFEDRSLREETMEPGDIAALARLPGVEDARFWFDCHFKLDINDIRHMGEAWSRLKSLVLSAWQPNPPLSHLIPFANSFPVIEQLIAPFDCNSPLPLAIDVSARFSTLKTLWILDAVIEANTDGSLIAEFLSMVCGPNVKIQMTEDVMDLPQMFEERRDWVDDSFENREKLDDILRRIEAFHRVQEGIRRMA